MRKIHKSVVKHKSEIGQKVEIKEFCVIRESIICVLSKIEERVSIKKSRIGAVVEIGAGTCIENAYIDNNVVISPNCTILGVYYDFSQTGINKKTKFNTIEIGSNSWICQGSTILPGRKIGNYAIVAPGSIVAKNVPDGCIYLGTPNKNKIFTLKEWEERK